MKTVITIIILLLSSTLVQAQKEIELEFLKGEWMSDSLRTSESKRWREFIFIDSLGQFYRTTWWSENYLLDKKLNIERNKIKKNNADYLNIIKIDSNTIELNGIDYYGLFKRDRWPNIGSPQESLNRFIVGDSIKKMLTGKWNLKKIEVLQSDKNADYPREYLDSYKYRDFLNQSAKEQLEITFRKNNKFQVNGNNGEINYHRFIVDDEKIQLWKSDYIISLYCELNKGDLIIIETKHGIERKLIFNKVSG